MAEIADASPTELPGSGVDAAPDTPDAYVLSILDRELRLTLAGVELGSQRDRSMRALTRTVATLYEGRILRELVQNAYDGAGEEEGARILLRLDRSREDAGTVDVANSGSGFGRDNVDAIVNPALSSKRPGNSIGHKGLGFRSVGLICEDPQIFSVRGRLLRSGTGFDGYCFRFADVDAQLRRLRRISVSPGVEAAAGVAHPFQLPIPILAEREAVKAFVQEGFATLVRLPLRDGAAADLMSEEVDALFGERAPLALFLDRLADLTIEVILKDGAERRTISRSRRPHAELDGRRGLAVEVVTTDGRRYLVARRPVARDRFLAAVRRAIDAQFPVEKWLDWEGTPLVSVAFALDPDPPAGLYYAFLPTECEAPFHGHLDAPFLPDPDRKGISLANPLNDMLVDVAAEACASLAAAIADTNTKAADLTHAAVDALAWRTERARVVRALNATGTGPTSLLLPSMRRAGSDRRWASAAEIFDWSDDDHRSLKAAWITKVCDVPIVRRNMGARRVDNLRELARALGAALAPGDWRIASWIPRLAADLNRRRRFSRQGWEDFYRDVGGMPGVLPHLAGKAVFRSSTGRLCDANSGGKVGRFYIGVAHAAGRRRRRMRDGDVYPPPSVTRNTTFGDPAVSWTEDVANAFFAAGLASEFSLVEVLAELGALLGDKPSRRRQMSALTWAFSAWSDNRVPEVERALATCGLAVPAASGDLIPAGEARFSTGWRGTDGELLAAYCAELSPRSRIVKRLADRLLLPWDRWPDRAKGSVADWAEFLRNVGVGDGLSPVSMADEEHTAWWWRRFQNGEAEHQAIENTTGRYFRLGLRSCTEAFRYSTKTYSPFGSLWVLPGQAFYAEFTSAARHAFARLVLAMLRRSKREWFETVLRKSEGNPDRVTWASPMAAFLRLAPWLPLAGADDFEGAPPSRCWFAPRGDLPRFVRRLERGARDVVEESETVRSTLSGQLGMPLWGDPQKAALKIAFLGEALRDHVSVAEHDSFRKAYREAWTQWAEPEKPRPFSRALALAVDRSGRLARLDVDGSDADRETVYVADGTSPMLEHLLGALGAPVLQLPAAAADKAIAALRRSVGEGFSKIAPEELRITLDGADFQLSEELAPLVDDRLEWLAELSVLVLEVNSPLTSRNTASARQQLHDGVKRVRIRYAKQVSVSIGTAAGALPDEMQGVLPLVGGGLATLVVEGRPEDMGWSMLARLAGPLAMAVGRPDLADGFRLTFLALEGGSRDAGGGLGRPTDEAVARALGRPVSRVRELYRSLRSSMERLLNYLVPAVHALAGPEAADRLTDMTSRPIDDVDLQAMLQGAGMTAARATQVLDACRTAESMNELRRQIGIDLATFNGTLSSLGGRWRPISFADALKRSFQDRVRERRVDLERTIRDARIAEFDEDRSLAAYASDIGLDWLTMPAGWTLTRDEVGEVELDRAIDAQLSDRFGSVEASGEPPVEEVRQVNRSKLILALDRVRRIVRAWAAQPGRAVPSDWTLPSDQIVRKAVISGALDFRPVAEAGLPMLLRRANLWPAGMEPTLQLEPLGLREADLALEQQQERRRTEEDLRIRRSIGFGATMVDGGAPRPFDDVAAALAEALRGDAFRRRSGTVELEPATDGLVRRRKGGSSRGAVVDPDYMSEEQRKLLGFAGELAAFHYLKATQRNFSEDFWVSSMGRIYLGRDARDDTEGYDFHIPRVRGDIYFEVKAHVGDPGYIDLERSQIMSAAAVAAGRGGARWGILYVANVRNPEAIAVHELPNPYAADGARYFREQQRGGVRLLVQRRQGAVSRSGPPA